ncbi:retrotransposon poly [Fusarium albosuccineum]|uniref:Retrotransposon poly n=1 Tax=Fusarium albosuccineum TaxID=1237068 RepID=A0A8H4KXX8_9HYPO|nr:retrotransposon poly [Fusarium albosuccineum]
MAGAVRSWALARLRRFLWRSSWNTDITTTRYDTNGNSVWSTPYEVFWNDIKPDEDHRPRISHLRMLGSRVFVHIEPENRGQIAKLPPLPVQEPAMERPDRPEQQPRWDTTDHPPPPLRPITDGDLADAQSIWASGAMEKLNYVQGWESKLSRFPREIREAMGFIYRIQNVDSRFGSEVTLPASQGRVEDERTFGLNRQGTGFLKPMDCGSMAPQDPARMALGFFDTDKMRKASSIAGEGL